MLRFTDEIEQRFNRFKGKNENPNNFLQNNSSGRIQSDIFLLNYIYMFIEVNLYKIKNIIKISF